MTSELVASNRPGSAKASVSLVVFTIDHQCHALPLPAVERVVPVVEITPVPQASGCIAGVVNVQGRIVLVMDCRKRFHLPSREVELTDQLLIARVAGRTVALLVDRVEGVVEALESDIVAAHQILPGMEAQGALKLHDGSIVLIHDSGLVLNAGERQLEFAMIAT